MITQVAAEIVERGTNSIAGLGLDGRSLGVLMTLANAGPLTQQQLGQQLGIDRTTMVTVVDHLEADGWVVRHRRPPDRRGNRVTITDSGEAVLAEADGYLQACEDRFVGVLSEAERADLMTLLRKLPHKEVVLRARRGSL